MGYLAGCLKPDLHRLRSIRQSGAFFGFRCSLVERPLSVECRNNDRFWRIGFRRGFVSGRRAIGLLAEQNALNLPHDRDDG